MKIIRRKLENCKPGDILGGPVLFNGALIFSKNTEITDEVIQRLKDLKIDKVKVKVDDDSKGSKKEGSGKVSEDQQLYKLKNELANFNENTPARDIIFVIRQLASIKTDEIVRIYTDCLDRFNEPSVLNEIVIQSKKINPDHELLNRIYTLLFSHDTKLSLSAISYMTKNSNRNDCFKLLLKLYSFSGNAKIHERIISYFKDQPADETRKIILGYLENEKDRSVRAACVKMLEIIKPESDPMIVRIPKFSRLSKADLFTYYTPVNIQAANLSEAAEIFKENYIKANSDVQNIFSDIAKNTPDLVKVKRVVSTFLDQIFYDKNLTSSLRNIYTNDNYLYSHAVNVCMLSMLTGIFLKYEPNQIAELGIAALMSDIGMIKLKKPIWKKSTRLNRSEKELVKYHIFEGIEMLTQSDETKDIIATVALHHHERCDGSGYLGFTGNELEEYVKIISIADVYDALTSSRPYRKPFNSYRALNFMIANTPDKFDLKCMRAFIKHVGLFPIGAKVLLSNGVEAKITGVNEDTWYQPKIVTIDNKSLDLQENKKIFIQRVIEEEGKQYENWGNI